MQIHVPTPLSSALTTSLAAARAGRDRVLRRWPAPMLVGRLSVLATAGMFIVLVMGTLVTNTGSQNGCGNSWPLCRGAFIPQFAVSTFIEFSHRAVTGVESVLVLAMAAGVLWLWRARLEIRILAPLMVIFLFAQAGLGALAVEFPESAAVLALHFGVSLIAFASILLTTLFVYELGRSDKLRDRALPTGFRALAWGLTIYSYVVVYLGAFVRHANVSLDCQGWPLCNGQVFPGFAYGVGAVFTHRLAALVLTVGVAWLFLWARRRRAARPDLYWGSLAALALVLLQAAEGAVLVFSRLELFSTLAHGALVALLFGALCYVSLHTLPRPRAVRQQARAHHRRRPAPQSPRAVASSNR